MTRHSQSARPPDDGFMLVGLIVAIFLILLTLSVAAPRIAYALRRDREVEAMHRGNQYVRAIQVYYKKFGHYPGSLEQLQKTNNVRFLRQNYVDPMTGKQDFRVIPVGQNQTSVKGFFGQPLAGLAGGGLGSASSLASSGFGAIGATGASGATGPTNVSANGAVAATGATGASGAPGATGAAGAFGATGSSGPFSGGASAGGSPFMGVGLGAGGTSILELNGQKTYESWEFLYDPRIELLKQKAGLNGANAGSVGASTLGQTPGSIGAPGASGAPGTGTLPAAPPSSPFTVQPPQ